MEEVKNESAAATPGEIPGVQSAVVKLNNSDTAEQFKCTYTQDCIVHVPGIYYGLISNVTPPVAAKLIEQGHRAFVRKQSAGK
jgi:hypothetical protein